MPIGFMGSMSLSLLDWCSRRFGNKKRERTNTCLCCFLPPRWNTLRLTQATVKINITHNNFRHCKTTFLETAVYILQCLHHLNLWVKQAVRFSHFLQKNISSRTGTIWTVYNKHSHFNGWLIEVCSERCFVFHLLEGMVSSVWGEQQKAKVETYAFVNFMSACFSTTKPDLSELK